MSKAFHHEITVSKEHIDALNHVNNEVYLRWLLQAAGAHSDAVGYDMKKFLEIGESFVVRRHEIDYLASAYLGEKLTVVTWIKEIHSTRAHRQYKIIRERDSKTLIAAETLWVYVDLKTGRPTKIPQEILQAFPVVHIED